NAQFDDFIAGTGLFGYPKMIANRDKELVICYRGKINQFYQFYRASVVGNFPICFEVKHMKSGKTKSVELTQLGMQKISDGACTRAGS
ncbi:MAG: hypothetical protein I4N51_04090, partial [Acinetobacter sp.]|nr:hypothetical protein [Acinetobacter sp.]